MTSVGDGWKKVRVGQTETWHQCLKSLTCVLSHVGRCRVRGWVPCDYRNQWLETVGDMAENRSQWRRCILSVFLYTERLKSLHIFLIVLYPYTQSFFYILLSLK
ncbi:unnamed protein product [Schistosoma mattheei]|uniref:Uncharacterized protein n=1 Tax=Schistosoma mattheei TaxID=31246 RepID=A0A3P8D0X7_9TREM|nr:unnamed protein product [Schistosoma mattheei]